MMLEFAEELSAQLDVFGIIDLVDLTAYVN
jgi:hypothetical protein